MDLNGQFVGWRHDHDLGRSLRRINARKEGQQISQCFTGTRLRSQIRVLPGSERRNCGDLNGAGVGYLLLRERSYELRWQRQIGKLHEIELATVASNTCLSRGMVAGRAVILASLLATPIGGITWGRLPWRAVAQHQLGPSSHSLYRLKAKMSSATGQIIFRSRQTNFI